jgi:predicted phosphodiesterase
MPGKICSCCGDKKDSAEFRSRTDSKDGTRHVCRDCENKRRRGEVSDTDWEEAARLAERLASDHEPLRFEDFDVSVGNDHRKDRKASKEKRQEFSKSMADYTRHLIRDDLTGKDGHYIAALAEQERRFHNRRIARSTSIAAANESLHIRLFKAAAEQYLKGKITPTGYANRAPKKNLKRAVCLLLTDLHIGAEMSELDNPIPYRATQEARRLEYVIRQAIDYKPQYRENSELVLFLGGDVIDGMLMHDLRDGAPLTEQMVAFWKYFGVIVGLLSQAFPKVRIVCQSGNHGRNKLRHPGRATSSKWDGVEFQLYYALSMMAANLKNVTFDIGFRALSIIDLFGSKVALTHGDTEIKFGHPDKKAKDNVLEVAKLNASHIYGVEFSAVLAGHFHTPRYQPGHPALLFNGMLVPPNGFARSEGFILEQCGQWLWEAVEGFPIGDLRYLAVGKAQDDDEKLGKIIVPWRIDS